MKDFIITQNQVMTFIIVWLVFLTFTIAFLTYRVIGKPYDIISQTTTSPTTTQPSTTTITKVVYPNVKCNITLATLYYLPTCQHCHRQLIDGTYDSIVKSGVAVKTIDVSTGNYNITAVPDWNVNGIDNYGYQTWEQLKAIFQCQ